MAITVESSTFNISSGSLTYDLTITVPSGDNVAVCVAILQRGSTNDWVSSVVLDPAGNNEALTRRTTGTDSSQSRTYIYDLLTPTAGTNLTLRLTAADINAFMHFSACVISADDSISYDTSGTGTGTGTQSTLNITPSDQPVFILAASKSEANSASTGAGSWADTSIDNTDQGSWISCSAYAVKTATDTVATTFDFTQSDLWLVGNGCWIAPGAGSISGSGSATLAAATLAAAGETPISGSGSATLAAATLEAAGTVENPPITGTGAATLAAATLEAAGETPISGSGSPGLAAATLAAAGEIPTTGSGSATLASATLESAGVIGSVPISGSGAATLAAATLAAAGEIPTTGSGSATLASATLAAAGTVENPPGRSNVSITLGAVTSTEITVASSPDGDLIEVTETTVQIS